ncbi:MAG: hypothetical protein ABIG42_00045 [bacterium]
METDVIALLIPIFAVIGSFAVAILGIMQQSRKRELLHEERKFAMERGLPVPRDFEPRRNPVSAHKNAALVNRKVFVILFFIGWAFLQFFPEGDDAGKFIGAVCMLLSFAFLVISFFKYKMTPEEEKFYKSESDFGAPLNPVVKSEIEQNKEDN